MPGAVRDRARHRRPTRLRNELGAALGAAAPPQRAVALGGAGRRPSRGALAAPWPTSSPAMPSEVNAAASGRDAERAAPNGRRSAAQPAAAAEARRPARRASRKSRGARGERAGRGSRGDGDEVAPEVGAVRAFGDQERIGARASRSVRSPAAWPAIRGVGRGVAWSGVVRTVHLAGQTTTTAGSVPSRDPTPGGADAARSVRAPTARRDRRAAVTARPTEPRERAAAAALGPLATASVGASMPLVLSTRVPSRRADGARRGPVAALDLRPGLASISTLARRAPGPAAIDLRRPSGRCRRARRGTSQPTSSPTTPSARPSTRRAGVRSDERAGAGRARSRERADRCRRRPDAVLGVRRKSRGAGGAAARPRRAERPAEPIATRSACRSRQAGHRSISVRARSAIFGVVAVAARAATAPRRGARGAPRSASAGSSSAPSAGQPRNRSIRSMSRPRSASRPRWIRDFTVPTETPVMSAISA